MKGNTVKTWIVIIAIAAIAAVTLSSCHKEGCPTYSKVDAEVEQTV